MKRSVAIIGLALVCAVSFWGLNTLTGEGRSQQLEEIRDPVEYLTGVAGDAVVFTVDGQSVTAEEYLYWVGYSAELMEQSQGSSQIVWDVTGTGGMTALESVRMAATETAKYYKLVELVAQERGFGLTEENRTAFAESYEMLTQQLGGEQAMENWLLQVGISKRGLESINNVSYLYENLVSGMAEPRTASREEMEAYIADNDLLKAKHILLMTKDPATNEALSEEEQAAKKALAEQLLTQLRESGEPLVLFDQLMEQYSEDTGLAAYPEGYTFGPGQMVEEFEQGTRALDFEQISDIVESDFGYHIILRLDPAGAELAQGLGEAMSQSEAQEQADSLISQRMEQAQTETTPVYDQLDIPAYYDALKTLRAQLEEEPAA